MFARPVHPAPRPAAMAKWLFVVAFLVFVMIVVGGITRLTESGLSMVRWEPITGIVPPLSEADWQAEFDHYRSSPEYQVINRGMSLEDFKTIFFWEYVHRVLGRLIGLVFAVPLLLFWWKRAIPAGHGARLVGLLGLGALQGAIGWWMVASGLVDVPEVSHIRLAVHLLTAFLILAAALWLAFDLKSLAKDPERPRVKLPLVGIWAVCLFFLQALFGAYVAGLEAGYAFNSWPLMGEEIFPSATVMLDPWYRNLSDNPIVVQFIHRWLAFPAAAVFLWLAWRAWRLGIRQRAALLAGCVVAQILLGILTLLSGVQIDIAVAHQGMAALLLGAIVMNAFAVGERRR